MGHANAYESMRKTGESFSDKGFFEIDLENGQIRWANSFALLNLGYTLDEIRTMSIFDLVPIEYHELLNNAISVRKEGGCYSSELIAMKNNASEIVWWYTSDYNIDLPILWTKGEYLKKIRKNNDHDSQDGFVMAVIANILQSHNSILIREKTSERENKIKFNDVNKRIDTIESNFLELNKNVQLAVSASRSAANKSIETHTEFNNLKKELHGLMDSQTTEILKLISSSLLQEEKIKSFESAINDSAKKAVSSAVEAIQKQSEIISSSLDEKTNESNKKLSQKITIPIGFIMIFAAVVQWLLQHFSK